MSELFARKPTDPPKFHRLAEVPGVIPSPLEQGGIGDAGRLRPTCSRHSRENGNPLLGTEVS